MRAPSDLVRFRRPVNPQLDLPVAEGSRLLISTSAAVAEFWLGSWAAGKGFTGAGFPFFNQDLPSQLHSVNQKLCCVDSDRQVSWHSLILMKIWLANDK